MWARAGPGLSSFACLVLLLMPTGLVGPFEHRHLNGLSLGSRPYTRCNQCPLVAQSGHGAMSESCPLLEKRISLPGCIERLHFEGTLGPLPLAPRTLGLPSGPNGPYSLA